jgi:hypothetical protein
VVTAFGALPVMRVLPVMVPVVPLVLPLAWPLLS